MSSASAAGFPGVEPAPPPAGAQGGGGRWRSWALRLVVLLLLVAGVLWVRKAWFSDLSRPQPRVQRVALVASQRPPPKLPDKPPERPREIEARSEAVIAAPNAERVEKAQPENNALGVDTDGQGAGDGFGLLGRRGGRDITTIGEKPTERSGPSELSQMSYAGLVVQRLRQDLAAEARLKESDYVVVVHLWIDTQGHIVRCELPIGSGHPRVDSALREALMTARRLPEPPTGLPQPIRIRIRVTSRELNPDAFK